MASGLSIIFPVQTIFDIESGNKAMQDMQNALGKAKPVPMKWDISAEHGKSMVEQLQGGASGFLNMIDNAATGAGKLQVTYKTLVDAQNKVVATIPISEYRTFTSVTGELSTETVDLSANMNKYQNELTKGNLRISSTITAQENFAKAEQMTGKALESATNEVNKQATAADKLIASTSRMGGAPAKAAKEAAKAVQEAAKEFRAAGNDTNKLADAYNKLKTAAESMAIAQAGLKTGANAIQNFTTRIANAIQQTIAYSFSIGLVYKAQQLLNDSIKYAIDLNTEMVKIQVLQAEGAKTPEEIDALAQSFNDLGKEMGASTLEIARGSVEWFRQGRTVAETQELMRASMMLSKLGAMQSADATNYLTSITNAFKIEVADTATVVDKLIAVDNIAATSAGELATAMRYTSESAAIAGVEMEQLVSYIATVSTVTRQNAEMIGQAFKTMFARMTQIQGGGTDEEGWTISKVEKALAAVNIEIKNSDGTWRNMGTVLEETAAKWDTLNTREQTEIATAVAGVRQKEAFLVLMDNMDKALTYQAAQTEATGLAMDRYGIYLESVEAKQGKLTASIQELYASVVNSKMVSAFYDIAISIVQTITQGKLLIPILTTILYLIIAINRETIKGKLGDWLTAVNTTPLVSSFIKLGSSIKNVISWLIQGGFRATQFKILLINLQNVVTGLGTKLLALGSSAGPYLLAVAPLAIATAGWAIHKKQVEDATAAVEEFMETQAKMGETKQQITDLVATISELSAKKNISGVGSFGGEDAERLQAAFSELQAILPNLDWKWKEGRPFLDQAVDVNRLKEEINSLGKTTDDLNSKLYIYTQENLRNYQIEKYNLEQAQKKQEVLEGIWNAYKDKGAVGVKEYHDELMKTYDGLPEAAREGIDRANDIIGTRILSGQVTSGWEDRMSKAMIETSSYVSEQEDVVSAYEQMFKKLISMGIDSATLEIAPWLERLVKLFPKIFGDLVTETKLDIMGTREDKGEKDNPEAEAQAELTASVEEANAAYEKQLQLIDMVVNALKTIKDTDASTLEGKAALTKSMLDFKNSLAKLGPEFQGLSDRVMMFYDIQRDTWNTKGLENYFKQLALNEDLMKQIGAVYPELIGMITAFANNSVEGVGAANEAMVEYVNENGVLTSVTESQWEQLTQGIAQQLFAVAENQDITFTDMNGNALTTVQQLQAALAAQLLTFESAAIQSGQKTVGIMAEIAKYMADLFKFVTELTPYEPAPISLPPSGGGGGKGKDPRVAAIEDEIKGYQDEIYHLEEIIEDLEERIKPIQDAIDAEQRLIELHQREIDVINEQIDHIDRQIELKERQIDAIDDLIEKEERRKDVLDRQIDSYQRQIDLIDRQIEMHERDKEVLEDAIKAQEKMKEPFEAQKEELEKLLDSFNVYIDAQKEALEVQKEEADYAKKLLDLNKKLSATQAELAMASLDTSEEGMKRRLELEMQLAEDQEALTETTEERKFELQVKALEEAQKAYEKSIKAQQDALDAQIAAIDTIIASYEKQIEDIDYLIKQHELEVRALEDLIYPLEQQKIAIDLIIQGYEDSKIPIQDQIKLLEDSKIPLQDAIYLIEEEIEKHEGVILVLEEEKYALEQLIKPYQDQIDKLNELIETLNHEKSHIEENTAAVGGSGPSYKSSWTDVDETVKQVMEKIEERLGKQMESLGITKDRMQELVQKWIDAGDTADAAYEKAKRYIEFIQRNSGEGAYEQTPTPIPQKPTPTPRVRPTRRHEGGFASEHGKDYFEGKLKESEIFAKLLKGEYVATEDQMRSFLKKTLPNIAIEATKILSYEKESLKTRPRDNSSNTETKTGIIQRPPSTSIQPIIINSPPRPPSNDLIKPIAPRNSLDNTYGDMNFEMNINVEGSLDEKVLPRLKKDVIKEINKSLEKRGIRRNAVSFSI